VRPSVVRNTADTLPLANPILVKTEVQNDTATGSYCDMPQEANVLEWWRTKWVVKNACDSRQENGQMVQNK